jgi:hypothetical protein
VHELSQHAIERMAVERVAVFEVFVEHGGCMTGRLSRDPKSWHVTINDFSNLCVTLTATKHPISRQKFP